jgi:hypothetical protein
MLTRLITAGVATLCFFIAGMEITSRIGGSLVMYQDPAESAEALAAEGRWAEAAMLAEFSLSRPDLSDPKRAAEVSRRASEELDSFRGQIERFAHGAITGEPTDMASMMGSLSLDLFVIGDIRDLAVQGWKEAADGTGDSVILALSAVGLTTTLAPQLDWAPALLKALKRSGALTREFVQSLLLTVRQAAKTRDYGRLTTVVGDFGQAAKRLGPGPLRGAMAAVDSADDLSRVSKAAEFDANGTYALARLFGKDGVKAIGKDGKNVGSLLASVKGGSRISKFLRKTAGSLPTAWIVIILVVSLLALIYTVRPGKRRSTQTRVTTR